MKKLILLLGVFLLFGFNTTGDNDIILKATKIEFPEGDKCAVTLELHNQTDRKINYLSMYCSDSGFYITDNPDVIVTPKPCGKNFPISIPIVKNSYRISNLELEIQNKIKQAKFRIGFKFIEIPKGIPLNEFDSTSVKSVTIWSNAIEFKSH